MAVYKRSGSRRTAQRTPAAPATEVLQPLSEHVRVFEAAANLNRGFDLVLNEIEQLKALGLFRGEFPGQFAKSCVPALEELRARAIFEVTEDLHQRAQDDWTHYGRQRLRWETEFRDPNEVPLDARRNRKRAVRAPKKGGRKDPRKRAE